MLSVHAGRVHGRDRAILLASLAAVVAAGWTALVLWGASPWSGYLSHTTLEHGAGTAETLLFVVGWTLMTVAMMVALTVLMIVYLRATTTREREQS